ncbi:hypothetical protein BDV97DRAFT_166443 [Delphinella strobiligena]|nr:hypothetical protein BDV97DRAFT_166443 [Delphinella strobiligena]
MDRHQSISHLVWFFATSTMSFCDYSSPQYPCPQANPDISGIGVFVSSLVIGLAATISSFCQAILRNKIKRLKDHHIEGSVVKLYIFWCDVLERIIISLADQQIVTGYALVVTAYSRLPSPLSHRGKQQPAQFALVIYLSGISGITHLTCMSTLGTYLDNHPTLTRIRFALMICFGVWLILSIGFLSASYHDTRSVLGILCLCFLLEYSSTLLKLIPSSRKWMLERTKRYPFISRISKPSLDLTATMAGLSCTFFLAIWQKFIPGCDGRDAYPTHDVAENVWGFGQVLPMVMLLLPMSSGLESLKTTRRL